MSCKPKADVDCRLAEAAGRRIVHRSFVYRCIVGRTAFMDTEAMTADGSRLTAHVRDADKIRDTEGGGA